MRRCRSCNAPVLWCRTTSGKATPVDPDPADTGNILLSDRRWEGGDIVAVVLAGDTLADARGAGDLLHLSHFVTCPQRKEWRRTGS